jgi:integrase
MPEGSSASDAKSVEAELRRAAGKREVNIPGDPMMPAIMELYTKHAQTLRSPDTAEHHALRAGRWLIGKRASEAQQAAQAMIDNMRGHYAPATINRSLGAIKKALSLAYLANMIPTDYGDKIRRLPENNERHTYLSVEQVKQLADAASEHVRAAIWIALLTGCRRGEILKLTADDISRNALRIRSGNTKTLRERSVPIVQALRPWIKHVPLTISMEGLKTGFRRAREAIGRPDIHFHDLRHSTASLLINMGVSLDVIRVILGHSSTRMTDRYSHLEVRLQADALRKLSAKVKKIA